MEFPNFWLLSDPMDLLSDLYHQLFQKRRFQSNFKRCLLLELQDHLGRFDSKSNGFRTFCQYKQIFKKKKREHIPKKKHGLYFEAWATYVSSVTSLNGRFVNKSIDGEWCIPCEHDIVQALCNLKLLFASL